jgi:hypothetical protein
VEKAERSGSWRGGRGGGREDVGKKDFTTRDTKVSQRTQRKIIERFNNLRFEI